MTRRAPWHPRRRRPLRVPWVDNLKITLITGAVVHAATAYIVDIDWYYDTEGTTSRTVGEP